MFLLIITITPLISAVKKLLKLLKGSDVSFISSYKDFHIKT